MDKIDKIKENKYHPKSNFEDEYVIEEIEPLTEEEAGDYEDNNKDFREANFWRKNPDRYWSYMQADRLMKMLYRWIIESKDGVFIGEFCHWLVPRAVEAGRIKKFPGSGIVSKTDITYITHRWPDIKRQYNDIKSLQDYKVTMRGLKGEWNAGLVQLYLKTHARDEWQETIKQEIVNKTQIVNIDPFEDDTTNNDTKKDN